MRIRNLHAILSLMEFAQKETREHLILSMSFCGLEVVMDGYNFYLHLLIYLYLYIYMYIHSIYAVNKYVCVSKIFIIKNFEFI